MTKSKSEYLARICVNTQHVHLYKYFIGQNCLEEGSNSYRPDLSTVSGRNPGQLDTGQLGTGHLDTGQLGTGQLGTHESGKVGQLDTSI